MVVVEVVMVVAVVSCSYGMQKYGTRARKHRPPHPRASARGRMARGGGRHSTQGIRVAMGRVRERVRVHLRVCLRVQAAVSPVSVSSTSAPSTPSLPSLLCVCAVSSPSPPLPRRCCFAIASHVPLALRSDAFESRQDIQNVRQDIQNVQTSARMTADTGTFLRWL